MFVYIINVCIYSFVYSWYISKFLLLLGPVRPPSPSPHPFGLAPLPSAPGANSSAFVVFGAATASAQQRGGGAERGEGQRQKGGEDRKISEDFARNGRKWKFWMVWNWHWYETKKNMMTQSFMQIALLYLDKTNWEDFTTSLWRCLFIFLCTGRIRWAGTWTCGWLLEDAGLDA